MVTRRKKREKYGCKLVAFYCKLHAKSLLIRKLQQRYTSTTTYNGKFCEDCLKATVLKKFSMGKEVRLLSLTSAVMLFSFCRRLDRRSRKLIFSLFFILFEIMSTLSAETFSPFSTCLLIVFQKILVRCRDVFPRENIFLSGIFEFVIKREEEVKRSKPINDKTRLKVNQVLISFVQNYSS